jgi:exodeoxyribonuclease V beta subunit
VDWKSNTLNRRAENFSGEKLKHAMFEATYPLQYLFYTAALVKYLEHKLQREINEALYSKYFGGVYYIFLRGMCLDVPAGVYAARPPLDVIVKLLEALGCRSRKDSL